MDRSEPETAVKDGIACKADSKAEKEDRDKPAEKGDGADSKAENGFDDNVLVISQTRSKVILPYKTEELRELLKGGETECESLSELIERNYTLPLSRYKHGCISRAREAYALVREREKGSVWDALDLATEMFFTRFLHPAVITACKNLDQLDVYLDCLDKNEPDDFPFFRIRYEKEPPKSKSRHKTSDRSRR